MVFAMSFVAGMLSGYVRFPLYFLFPIVVERERKTFFLHIIIIILREEDENGIKLFGCFAFPYSSITLFSCF